MNLSYSALLAFLAVSVLAINVADADYKCDYSWYEIKKGDTMDDLLDRSGWKKDEMKKYNPNVDWDYLEIGQKICIDWEDKGYDDHHDDDYCTTVTVTKVKSKTYTTTRYRTVVDTVTVTNTAYVPASADTVTVTASATNAYETVTVTESPSYAYPCPSDEYETVTATVTAYPSYTRPGGAEPTRITIV